MPIRHRQILIFKFLIKRLHFSRGTYTEHTYWIGQVLKSHVESIISFIFRPLSFLWFKKNKFNRKADISQLIRIRTSHWRTAAHLQRIAVKKDPLSRRGFLGDLNHVLFACSLVRNHSNLLLWRLNQHSRFVFKTCLALKTWRSPALRLPD